LIDGIAHIDLVVVSGNTWNADRVHGTLVDGFTWGFSRQFYLETIFRPRFVLDSESIRISISKLLIECNLYHLYTVYGTIEKERPDGSLRNESEKQEMSRKNGSLFGSVKLTSTPYIILYLLKHGIP